MPTKVTEDRSTSKRVRTLSGRRGDAAGREPESGGEESPGVRKLYTVAMMAGVLRVPPAAVRHWVRGGLLAPARCSGALQWFDYPQLVVGRRLARLLGAGLSLREIDAKLSGLARGGATEAARDGGRIVADGRRLSIQRRGRLLGAGGQLQFDFYTDGLAAADDGVPRPSADDIAPVVGLPPSGTTRAVTVSLAVEPVARTASPAEPADRETTAGDPHGIAELLDLADDLEAAGELVEASEALRAVLQAQGPTAAVVFMLADLLYRTGDLTGARERYYNVLEIDDDHLEARANLGCVLAELGEQELALAALEGVLHQQPDYADAHWHMAGVLRDTGRPVDARRHLQAFLTLAPESPWASLARERLARE